MSFLKDFFFFLLLSYFIDNFVQQKYPAKNYFITQNTNFEITWTQFIVHVKILCASVIGATGWTEYEKAQASSPRRQRLPRFLALSVPHHLEHSRTAPVSSERGSNMLQYEELRHRAVINALAFTSPASGSVLWNQVVGLPPFRLSRLLGT